MKQRHTETLPARPTSTLRRFHIAILTLLMPATLILVAYQLFYPGPGAAFFFMIGLALALAVPLLIGILLRKGSRLRDAAYWLGAMLPLAILVTGAFYFGQAVYWVKAHPDHYKTGRIVDGVYEGELLISPTVLERNTYSAVTLTFRAGPEGLQEGGGLILRLGQVIPTSGKLRFYDFFYQDMWADTLQVNQPAGQGYVTVRVPAGIEVDLSKPAAPPHDSFLLNTFVLDAALYTKAPDQPSYFPHNTARRHEVHLKIVKGSLQPGEELTLVLGDTASSSPGWRMPAGEALADLLLYADPTGEGFFRMVSSHATLEVGGGSAVRLELLAPSTMSLGEEFSFVVRAIDDGGFLSLLHQGTIELPPMEGITLSADSYTFTPGDRGAAVLAARADTPDVYRLQVHDTASGVLYFGNPMVVAAVEPEERLYWGDLHQHSTLGKDANRTPQYTLERNRRAERLDFVSLSEHDLFFYWGTPLSPGEWNYLLEVSDAYYLPGEFVTLHGYEGGDFYHGHRNIYWGPGEKPLVVPSTEAKTPEELRQALGKSRYLVIPHHTAWRFIHHSVPYDWGDPDWEQLRLVEVYSKHGSSDHFEGPYPIHHDRTPLFVYLYGGRSHRAYPGSGSYVREALAAGYRLGLIAGSDNHWAQGGSAFGTGTTRHYQPGLQAAYAPALTREDIFNALWIRRTYGTTGARIFIDFRVDGAPMGSEITFRGEPPAVTFIIHGTAPLERVELWKYSAAGAYEQIFFEGGGQLSMEGTYTDTRYRGDSFYFLHVVQTDGHLAWAGPVWVDQ